MALPGQDWFLRGERAPCISPYFIHPTRALALRAISKEQAEHLGHKRTLSPGAQGVPYEFASFLTSQEPPLHHGDGFVLWTTPCDNCGWTFRHCVSCPLDHSLPSVLSSTKGTELCLQYMNPVVSRKHCRQPYTGSIRPYVRNRYILLYCLQKQTINILQISHPLGSCNLSMPNRSSASYTLKLFSKYFTVSPWHLHYLLR